MAKAAHSWGSPPGGCVSFPPAHAPAPASGGVWASLLPSPRDGQPGAIRRAPLLPPGAPRGQPTLTGQVGTGEPAGGTEPLRLLGSLREAPIALPCAPHCAESRYPGSCPLLSQRGRRAWKLKHKGLNRKQEKELRRREPAG